MEKSGVEAAVFVQCLNRYQLSLFSVLTGTKCLCDCICLPLYCLSFFRAYCQRKYAITVLDQEIYLFKVSLDPSSIPSPPMIVNRDHQFSTQVALKRWPGLRRWPKSTSSSRGQLAGLILHRSSSSSSSSSSFPSLSSSSSSSLSPLPS